MSNLQHLLSHISTIVKKNEEFIEATGGRFNMFRILGVNHYENTHSAILAEFLNNKGSHGLKNQFLDAFLKVVADEVPDFKIDAANSYTKTEYATPEGRLDILIEDKKKRAVIIENKIYAGDQNEQLIRYNNYAVKEYGKGNYLIFYLTLSGYEASAQSGSGVYYIPISYKNHVLKWLEDCVNISARYPLVRETLNQYINSIKQLTNQGMEVSNNKEIVETVIKSTENLKSAMSIIVNESKIKEAVIKKLYNKLIEWAKDNALDFEGDHQLKKQYNGFYFKRKEWKNCRIAFEFQENNYRGMIYGIKCLSYQHINLVSTETHEKLKETFKLNYTPLWPLNKQIRKYSSWDNHTFIEIIEGHYQGYIQECVIEILRIAVGFEL